MKRTRHGFTLVELLVVIAILAVLATVSVVGYTSFIQRANESTALQEMTQIRDSVNAEDILNPNFAISGGVITVLEETDEGYDENQPSFSAFVDSLTTMLGADRTCTLSNDNTSLTLVIGSKKVQATWDFRTGMITTGKNTDNNTPETTTPTTSKPCESHSDADGDGLCETCGKDADHTHDYTAVEATCESAAKCACGVADPAGEALGHKDEDVDGVCDNACGITLNKVTLSYTGSTTANMVEGNNAATVGLNESIFSVVSDKGSTNYRVGLNKDHDLRLYNKVGESNGTTMTVSMADAYTILSIKITFKTNQAAYCKISANEEEILVTDGTSTEVIAIINANNFSLQNVNESASYQVQIKSIDISYLVVPHSCEENAESVDAVVPTCTEDGITAGTKCSMCGAVVSGLTVDPALQHIDSNTNHVCDRTGCETPMGTCADGSDSDTLCDYGCGKDYGLTETTISKTHTEMTTLAGVSTSNNGGLLDGKSINLDNNITVTFARGSATSDTVYYNDGIRLYQSGATMTITAKNNATMSKIVITGVSGFVGNSNLTVTGGTLEVNGTTLTITVDAGASTVVIKTGISGSTSNEKQKSRLYIANLSVTYAK